MLFCYWHGLQLIHFRLCFERAFVKRIVIAFILQLALLAYGGNKLRPQVAAIIDAEQNLISREVDELKIQTPKNNSQNPMYAPEAHATFTVKSYWVPTETAEHFFGTGVSPYIRSLMTKVLRGKTYVRLIVHPESEKFYKEYLTAAKARPAEKFSALSTSSSRTLLVWLPDQAEKAFFAKLSLDAEIGGVRRTIPNSEMSRSIGTNNILQADKARGDLPADFEMFPETFSMIPKNMFRGAMIIREVPEVALSRSHRILPLFSLYAQPKRGEPLLLKILKKEAGDDPYGYIEEKILRPFLEQYFEVVTGKIAINMEPHAQNVLLGLDNENRPNGIFYHRDFGGFGIDLAWRDKEHLNDQIMLPFIRSIEIDYHQSDDKSFAESLQRSIANFFIGGFVYNLDVNMQKWIAEEKLSGPSHDPDFLQGRVYANLHQLAIDHGVSKWRLPTPRQMSMDHTKFMQFILDVREVVVHDHPIMCIGLF